MRSIHRTLALALTLALGPAFLLLGCGGSLGPAASGRGDVPVPDRVAQQLWSCAKAHSDHLRWSHTVRFDVRLGSDGQVEEVALRSTTLDDEGLETCMASALQGLSEDDLTLRRAEARPRGPLGPEARALVGQYQLALAACLEVPPCAMALLVTLGVGSTMAVWVYVHPPTHPGPTMHPPHAPPATSASPLPTTTALPVPTTLSPADQVLWRKCNQQYETYKTTDNEAGDLARETNRLEDLLQNNKASAQQRAEYCSRLDELIKVVQRLYKERSIYIDLDCDKFDWFNKGTTAAQRRASHQNELNNVGAHLKNLYAKNTNFCQ